ncbi:class I SAM-dependent RNA methyltransferase [Oscillochloris sp. ZM17-4]|uniref:class I SAM-dependent RNA methyltransferase n=1 Tax=Oscillochloris sp. ZM17-4 TaxID=2866714 RepID=UPI001C736686|nr:class I SAM-dependent RNA methyltransferase [Oscillochloris sp. ZM17-4]MBX0326994.1 class I SAM-dependent RNA methyltransferase [Oscillochloris sp. ZM17-4]
MEELTLDIHGIAQGGDGVGRVDGMVVFVTGALPGETVRVQISERRQSYARGSVVEVLHASPDRVDPITADDGHAAWQHIAYPAQLRLKEQIIREQLAKLAGLSAPPVAPIIAAAQPWGYRNTAHLHVEGDRIGYHYSGSRHVSDLEHDPLLLPALNEALAGLREVLPTFKSAVEGVTLRASAAYGYAVGLLHGHDRSSPANLADLAAAWILRTPIMAGVAVDAPGYDQPAPVDIHDELGGVAFILSPETFFQVNAPQAERMLGVIREQLALQPGERLLDAYSGAGAFAMPLSAGLERVVAIEESPSAVADGARSLPYNGIVNVEFIQAAAERALPRIEGPFDAAIVDPPRRGCHPAVLEELARLSPQRIAYISCHPGILARDLGPLLNVGYRLDLVQPVDLFPQTPHVECVVILRK